MDLKIPGAKSLESAIGSITRFPFAVRVLLPGTFAALYFYAFVPGANIDLFTNEYWVFARSLALFIAPAIGLGLSISVMSPWIYQVYEGRSLWPSWVRKLGIALQQARVRCLLSRAKAEEDSADETQYAEVWQRLRRYPVDQEGNPVATHPTIMGNILASYEEYPSNAYGMDSVFFWPRIWLSMTDEKKKEVDTSWAPADGLLHLSAVLAGGGLALLLGSIWAQVAAQALDEATSGAPGGLGTSGLSFVGAYLIYRASIPFHLRNGEIFKSIFDIYRGNVEPMAELGPAEKRRWETVWAFLQYQRVVCSGCETPYPASKKACPECGTSMEQSLQSTKAPSALPRVAASSPLAHVPSRSWPTAVIVSVPWNTEAGASVNLSAGDRSATLLVMNEGPGTIDLCDEGSSQVVRLAANHLTLLSGATISARCVGTERAEGHYLVLS